MKFAEVEKVIRLQKQAYGLLIWVNQAARQEPGLLSRADLLASVGTCAQWINQNLNRFPSEFWPESGDFDAFVRLFSSFFTTSLRVGMVGRRDSLRCEPSLVRGAKEFKDRRHRKHSERRQMEAAYELKMAALSALALEADILLEHAQAEEMVMSAENGLKVTLWTYACELKRRTEYASQGTAVHELWLELDEKTRKRMDAEMIWKARDQLIAAFQEQKA